MISTSFLPDHNRAVAIDGRMRQELAASLGYLYSEISRQQEASNRTYELTNLEKARDFLSSEKKISPALFGNYYQLVFAILSNADDIQQRIDNLADVLNPCNELQILDLSAQDLGSQQLEDMYRQCLDSDEKVKYGFLPPSHEQSLKTRQCLSDAFTLMQEILPDLYDEIHAIIKHVLLASAPKEKNAPQFDGASNYQLWGAVALNAGEEKSVIEMLVTLAHECAHCLLFGLTVDEPLVRDAGKALYKSPFREDPRPMDGIYHATFVAARMYYALIEIMESPVLTGAQKQKCEKELHTVKNAFYEGYAVLTEHGRLSETGNEIMQNACHYMQGVAPLQAIATSVD